ncbi:MAG TPA: Ppx/GppA phosphatase family protein [Acidimicrobiia bacterium]|nr:Ppx/GppA phosphatase family protein [Acidimicrobiia bacterium]
MAGAAIAPGTIKAAAVDIGTNSMRLLLVQKVGSGLVELGRFERVTGLGRGVDANGRLSEEAIDRTLLALAEFGARMKDAKVDRRRAVATSASRDASNSEQFFDRAELALGVRPELIAGEEEARLSFAGASRDHGGSLLVIDIGGGSTEFVTAAGGTSYEIGSVRLTDRLLNDRPASGPKLAAAREMVAVALSGLSPFAGTVVGVAGTWTSLAAMEESEILSHGSVTAWVERLAAMTIEETAAIPGLDPARAPVMLGGTIVAEGAMAAVGVDTVSVSRHDLLDGVIADLIGVPT